MKKILLATSALVLSAAAANAQAVRIGGEGRMGILYESVSGGNAALNGSAWAQENRLQFNFTVTVQADHGLTFGAFTRARMNNGSTGVFSGSRVWVEANNFRLTFGNVDGAIRGAGTSHGYAGGCGVGYVGGHYCGDTAGLLGWGTLGLVPGYLSPEGAGQANQTHGFASTGGGPAARIRIDYSFGDTRVALSHDRNAATEFGIRSRFDAFTVALGYSNRVTYGAVIPDPAVPPFPQSYSGFVNDNTVIPPGIRPNLPAPRPGNIVALSGHYNGGTWGVGVLVVRVSPSNTAFATNISTTAHTNWSLSGNVELGGGNLYAYVGRTHLFGRNVGGPATTYLFPVDTAGISYGYGLGGGATLTAGIETGRIRNPVPAQAARYTSASVGVAFNF
jgi:hypothetical protein